MKPTVKPQNLHKKNEQLKRNLTFMQSLLDLIPMERINFHPIQVFQVLIQMTLKVSGKLSKIVPVAKFASYMCLILFLFRSMTRLNTHNSANRLENRIIHKSMTRLDHR